MLVAAPTGSGKTVVAEYAVASALNYGRKIFYTTPIKALSNQKFSDLRKRYGADRVGLLTGDNSINGDARVVVMTTEVLRNMIYAGSATLDGLGYVVLDEVHYLQDSYRGPVWEEVIIHTPASVQLVCLSATVSNAKELADWLSTVRGPTRCVTEFERPVDLVHLYMVGEKGAVKDHLLPTLVSQRANPEAQRFDRATTGPPRKGMRMQRTYYTPRRTDVIERLDDEDLLPALYFIFSRAACSDAARSALDSGMRFTNSIERQRIRALIDHHTAGLTDKDLDVLGFDSWSACMEAGIASHHAGMVPPFKEAVEACFIQGLIKVVFATETLALGVNMPARSVVIEKLSKYTGDHHESLTPSSFTQLAGRAGRRGIDTIGHAVVLWNPFIGFDTVAALALSRSFPLTSSFRPTFNMAVNLVRRLERQEAHAILQRSFAQFQGNRELVKTRARLDARQSQFDRLVEVSTCHLGDVATYRILEIEAEQAAKLARRSSSGDIEHSLQRLRPGDVVPHASAPANRLAVMATADRRGDRSIRVRCSTVGMGSVTISADDLTDPVVTIGHIALPQPYAPNDRGFQREVARRLRTAKLTHGHPLIDDPYEASANAAQAVRARDSHPVHSCHDRHEHLRALRQLERAQRDSDEDETRLQTASGSLSRKLDAILDLLSHRGYVDGWTLTPSGERLSRLFHESDLLVSETLEAGLFDGLDAASVAALASVFVYEMRSSGAAPNPDFPTRELRGRFAHIERLTVSLNNSEASAKLNLTRPPDPGFMALTYSWALGHALDEVLDDEEITGGDFVRTMKILIDLLRQIGQISPLSSTSAAARAASDSLLRGVVEASSRVGEPA